MNNTRFGYRTRQFWQTLRPTTSAEDLALASTILTNSQLALFQRLQTSEQAHSLRALSKLIAQGERDPDLLTATLLHDTGKTRVPLRPWERALIVLVKAICPDCAWRWGRSSPEDELDGLGWRRAFVVAEQHPAWGAKLAASEGAPPMAVRLIRRHQENLPVGGGTEVHMGDNPYEISLLRKLQAVDEDS